MNDFDPTKVGETDHAGYPDFGEGIIFKGSIKVPANVILQGPWMEKIIARDLRVGRTGT